MGGCIGIKSPDTVFSIGTDAMFTTNLLAENHSAYVRGGSRLPGVALQCDIDRGPFVSPILSRKFSRYIRLG